MYGCPYSIIGHLAFFVEQAAAGIVRAMLSGDQRLAVVTQAGIYHGDTEGTEKKWSASWYRSLTSVGGLSDSLMSTRRGEWHPADLRITRADFNSPAGVGIRRAA
jgi:hypothetical protein